MASAEHARLRLLHILGRRLSILWEDTWLLVRRDLERLACLEALRDEDLGAGQGAEPRVWRGQTVRLGRAFSLPACLSVCLWHLDGDLSGPGLVGRAVWCRREGARLCRRR